MLPFAMPRLQAPGLPRVDEQIWRVLALLDVTLAQIEEGLATQRRSLITAESDLHRAYV